MEGGGWTPENTLSFISSLLGIILSALSLGMNLLQKAKVDSARATSEENSKRLQSHDIRITENGKEIMQVATNPVRYVVQQPHSAPVARQLPAPAPIPATRVDGGAVLEQMKQMQQQILDLHKLNAQLLNASSKPQTGGMTYTPQAGAMHKP